MVKKKGNNSASSIANKPLSRFLTLKEERMRMNATLKAKHHTQAPVPTTNKDSQRNGGK